MKNSYILNILATIFLIAQFTTSSILTTKKKTISRKLDYNENYENQKIIF